MNLTIDATAIVLALLWLHNSLFRFYNASPTPAYMPPPYWISPITSSSKEAENKFYITCHLLHKHL